MVLGLVPSDGSDDNIFAMCAAEASSPSMSSRPSTDVSSTSNPVSVPENGVLRFSFPCFRVPKKWYAATLQSSSYVA
jgi:hypothetical protein